MSEKMYYRDPNEEESELQDRNFKLEKSLFTKERLPV